MFRKNLHQGILWSVVVLAVSFCVCRTGIAQSGGGGITGVVADNTGAVIPKATVTGNELDCGGGILTTGDPFTLNLQTFPNPSTGMGGGISVASGSGSSGPFAIKGP